MPTTSIHSFSSDSDLEYTGSDLSYGTISLGELCVAEKKQVVLRDASFQVGPAQKVDSWLDKLNMARDLSIAPEVVLGPWNSQEVLNEEKDEGIPVPGGLAQGLPSSPDGRREDFHSKGNEIKRQLYMARGAFSEHSSHMHEHRCLCPDYGKRPCHCTPAHTSYLQH
jgi:hypothetical protein